MRSRNVQRGGIDIPATGPGRRGELDGMKSFVCRTFGMAVPLLLSWLAAGTAAAAPEVRGPEQPGLTPGPEPGATCIMKWKDGKQAVFLLEFDDSCESHVRNVVPELKKRGMTGTFYVNPGNGPFKNRQAVWEKDVPAAGMEMGNHTFTHDGAQTVEIFERELARCSEAIDRCYPGRKQPRLISYGEPGVPKEKWGISKEERTAVLAKFNLVERPPFFGPPFHQKSAAEMLKVVDTALARGEMGHLDFHGVGGDWHVTPMDWFLALLDKLDAHRDRLWITDPVSWHRYEAERKAAVVTALAMDAREIRLQLTCSLDPVLYELPLTLATRLPSSWRTCTVRQGGSVGVAAVSDGVARYDAQPDGEPIVLRPE